MRSSLVIVFVASIIFFHLASAQDYYDEDEIPSINNSSRYGPLLAPHCGVREGDPNKVVGGFPAKSSFWPWLAILGYRGTKKDPKGTRWNCGGCLISARHVLTAGHCVYRKSDLYVVRLGDLDLESDNDGVTPLNVGIERGIVHPRYSETTYSNDIALLRLDQDVQFTRLLRPICLPVTEDLRQKNLEAAFPFVAGWGSILFDGPRSIRLQQIQIPVVSQETCKKAFQRFKVVSIDDRVICAGYAEGHKDACQGDSGGPLMNREGQAFYAIAVVSYGFKCAVPGYYGVYTKTASFLDFILPLLN